MTRLVWVFATGLLFGLGLCCSAMINPAKVIDFLDPAGNWDPSLALVMIGAIPVAALGFWKAQGLASPWLEPRFQLPAKTRIDASLLAGAALFGVGWGIAGFCPGPALASLALGNWRTLLFVAAMVIGMPAERSLRAFRTRKARITPT